MKETKPDLEVLIVNDDRAARFFQHRALLQLNLELQISPFKNGKEALIYVGKHPKKRFLVLLDLDMPVLDGWKFLEQLNSTANPDRFSVAVLSSGNEADRARASQYPQVVAYYEKTINFNKMKELLEKEPLREILHS